MFTDVEASTRLFHELGSAYPGVLARHQAIVRAALRRHDGHEVKTEGDSFFVAFADTPNAVAAAVDVQRELAAQDWPDGGAIRVRIGVHTGKAEPVDGDYVAIDVHRAARVAGVGHGGQIVLSGAAARAVADALPAACSLRALGRYRLRDFDESEPLSQVDGPGLIAEHPPLRALPAARHNIRPAPTRFVGRRRERLKLAKLSADNAIVTVVGQGGMGKSRLAAEVAIDLAEDMPDGSLLVELGALVDDDLVIPAIVEALGGRAGYGRGGSGTLADLMTGTAMLLVLDEAERVTAGVGAAVEVIVGAAPAGRVLITSRNPVGVDGEVVFQLEPLSLPDADDDPLAAGSDAVALVHDRLGILESDAVDADRLTAAAALCRRLDGLPLALELAAARVAEVGITAILDGLGETTGTSSQDAIRWSVSLLGPAAQRLFRRLRWLAAPADVATVEAIVVGDGLLGLDGGDVHDLLGVLTDRSLIRPRRSADGRLRYAMLETVRAVADAEAIGAGEAEPLDAALLKFVAERGHAERVAREEQGSASSDYGDELPVHLAAIDAGLRLRDPRTVLVMIEIFPTLMSHGAWKLVAQRAAAIDELEEMIPPRRLALKVARARAAFRLGDGADGLRHVAAAQAIFPEVPELQAAHAEADLAQELLPFDPLRASRFAEHALPILEAVNSNVLVAALVAAGATRMMLGNAEGGRAALRRCLELAEAAGDPRAHASALAALGNAAFSEGNFVEAVRLLDDAVERFRALDAPTQLGPALAMGGHARALLGDIDAGAEMLVESLAIRERAGDVVGTLFTKLNLADVRYRGGDRAAALAGFVDAYSMSKAAGVVLIQNAAAHGIAISAADADARAALVLLSAAMGRSIGTTGIDEPITTEAQARLRAGVADEAEAEAEGAALTDEEFLDRASALADQFLKR
jgi:predicted ATPase/class 3 adenylate cyclase